MQKNKPGKIIKKYAIISFGCILYAFSFTVFFQSNDLAIGGFTGLSQIITKFVPIIPIGTLIFLLNAPLMVIGLKTEGVDLLFSSFYSIILSSVFIDGINSVFIFPNTQPLLACIFGSILIGISLGILMVQNSTTGGTELLAKLIKHKIHDLSIGKLCLIVDVTVICIYALTFKKFESALYGILCMYISSTTMDTVIYGSTNGKIAYIISEKNDLIRQKLLQLGMGVTVVEGKGGFTGIDKNILLCALKKNKMALVKKTVAEYDPENAFLIVCDAKEVFGEGFGDYTGTGL